VKVCRVSRKEVRRKVRRVDKVLLYVIFFIPLAFYYEPLKKCLGGGLLFFACAVAYLGVCFVLVNFLWKRKKLMNEVEQKFGKK
jgi:hypothetical protein